MMSRGSLTRDGARTKKAGEIVKKGIMRKQQRRDDEQGESHKRWSKDKESWGDSKERDHEEAAKSSWSKQKWREDEEMPEGRSQSSSSKQTWRECKEQDH